ncbi:helix-turn-helix domain-containing protein [Natrialba taiwanensis]|uniref:Bacterio-opsin activator HTH domain protein n=1 Tax=Natrialba taiwanensis DSM 12281 TaxID=1230458 RepID=M0AGD8_9EURY|nr:helix-turn-helix domain-containing protein [Natrialba taiwanensis]ELY96423.1 Bacterio-opsin activator HTH domain protein [Natrialba taiwanensis DSM 12281]
MPGFRATVVVHAPARCPVAEVSETVDEPISSVTRTRSKRTDGTVTEEFGIDAGTTIENDDLRSDRELTPIQETDCTAIYRFERESEVNCACEVIEDTGTPISSVRAQDGSLLLSFRTLELEDVVEIVDELRARFDGVLVEDLAQDHGEVSGNPTIVDRDVLTARQREIIETAHEMGYFAYPKGANATEVADELGIARSTFTEHLAATQTKLMDAILAP